jgi:hypothetical protein
MIRLPVVLLAFVVLTASVCLAQEAPKKAAPPVAKPMATVVLSSDLKWGELPASMVTGTPSVDPGGELQTAVIMGDPSKAGHYVIRGKCNDGYKIAPHWHPLTENVTVLQGTLAVGMGTKWDDSQLKGLTSGSFASIPPHMAHFAQCQGETIIQVEGNGPFMLHFISPAGSKAKKPAAGN